MVGLSATRRATGASLVRIVEEGRGVSLDEGSDVFLVGRRARFGSASRFVLGVGVAPDCSGSNMPETGVAE